MAEHKFALDQTLFTAHPEAFLPREDMNLFHLDPEPVVFGDLDPNYTGLLFPDSGLERPDLASLLPDSLPEEVKRRVLLTIKESHTKYCERVQNLDSITRSLYTTAAGLVNDGMEAIRGYGKVVATLDVWQQSILRKSGPFVKPTTSKSSSKPGRDKTISYAMSSATSAAKKKRSRGKSRKIQGLLPHAAPPPFSPLATSTPAPAASPVHYGGLVSTFETWGLFSLT